MSNTNTTRTNKPITVHISSDAPKGSKARKLFNDALQDIKDVLSGKKVYQF